MQENNKIAIILGAGPAGLAAAYELLKNSDIKPIIIEQDKQVGGLSKTINYNGYLIDIGPHRFFSKSERVNKFWLELLGDNNVSDNKIVDYLKIKRLTRIFYLKKFFNYPISLSWQTLKNLGFFRTIKIGLSYLKSSCWPVKPEKNLADFYINRFGQELYQTFFEDYTEKVWGVPCKNIPPDWGAQRVKSLSIISVLQHALRHIFPYSKQTGETSLVEEFYYPRLGAGQMYEKAAQVISQKGGQIKLNYQFVSFSIIQGKIESALVKNLVNQEIIEIKADYFLSSIPVKELLNNFGTETPKNVKTVAENLIYRDYIIVGLLFKKMIVDKNIHSLPDNWLYIQEKDLKMGRLDIFNNFSSSLLQNNELVWLGAEYFCNEGDDFWKKNDSDIKNFAVQELEKINFIGQDDLLDFTVIKVKKAYPAYFGAYEQFSLIQNYLDQFDNLFLIGRNGMHKYNNMDHSILTGLVAADNIVNGLKDKSNIWEINTELDYHEEK